MHTNKIVNIQEAIKISKDIRAQGKTIVLAGGCFDVLHIGHIEFLAKAKRQGDYLFLLLESDEAIQKTKGKNRPINTQEDRAKVLSYISLVDYIITIPLFRNDKDYDNLTIYLKPAIIATTKGDPYRFHKERQAKLVNAKVIDVTETISNSSTSKILKLLSLDKQL